MSTEDRSHRRPPIGLLVGALLAVVIALAVALFLLAQNTAAPTSPQTNGALGALVVLLVPA